MINVVRPGKVEMHALFAHVSEAELHIGRQLMLKTEAPTLFVRRSHHVAQWASGAETHIVQKAQRVTGRRNEAARIWVAEMQIRGGAIVVVRLNHVGRLVEALGTVGGDAAGAVARLRIVDA